MALLEKRLSIHASVASVGRENIHETRPRAKKFLLRSASRGLAPVSLQASRVSEVMGTSYTVKALRLPSVTGLAAYPALARARSSKASTLTMRTPPAGRSCTFVFRAAGFMATKTLGASPGVRMSWSEMWTWKADTPARVPAGARISAGKSGSVERSLPRTALTLVKRSPVSCMPSPESPAKRMTTSSSSCSGCWAARVSVNAILPRFLSRCEPHVTAGARDYRTSLPGVLGPGEAGAATRP